MKTVGHSLQDVPEKLIGLSETAKPYDSQVIVVTLFRYVNQKGREPRGREGLRGCFENEMM